MLGARIERKHVIEGLGVTLLLMRDMISLLLLIHAEVRVKETPTLVVLAIL